MPFENNPTMQRFVNKMQRLMDENFMTRTEAKAAIHGRLDDECSAIKDAMNANLIKDGTFADNDEALEYEKYCRDIDPHGQGFFETRANQ